MSLTIDVISDVVCPWCYVGKKKLQTAIDLYKSQHPDAEIPLVRWHAFQLNPGLDESGMDRAEYVLNKFGSRASTVYDRVKNAGLEEGIEFAFDKIQRQPNTRKAHSLIAACERPELQEKMVQLLFDAYFILGMDLTDDKVLSSIAQDAGLDQALIEKALHSAQAIQAIEQADQYARSIGVQGVPFFVFNQKVAVSGAQGPETLVGAMIQSQGIG
jgi:predicted DsbA family dithiol-disulfide isomerase